MKKIALVLLALMMLCTLSGCGGQEEKKAASTLDMPLKDKIQAIVEKVYGGVCARKNEQNRYCRSNAVLPERRCE